ncbi:Maf family protein [Maioricimonas sp. JC845]|uniref:Maf family protein n=1 Tax=Maioricimonas sp. JC845 TaxID=3232138 RepID=UPI0034594D3E
MTGTSRTIVLGSRSPRRRELLEYLVSPERVAVRPPLDQDEPGFDELTTLDQIESRLLEIARLKMDDVARQLQKGVDATCGMVSEWGAILTADTVIVGADAEGQLAVLGQPPEDDASWQEVVRDWFERYLLGRPHQAMTALVLRHSDGRTLQRTVRTEVTFSADAGRYLDWYLSTGEPRGKAGGYGLQGGGALFVEQITGSPSNVIGLPLRETWDMLDELGLGDTIDPG